MKNTQIQINSLDDLKYISIEKAQKSSGGFSITDKNIDMRRWIFKENSEK